MNYNLSRIILAAAFSLSFVLPPAQFLRAAAPTDQPIARQDAAPAFAPDRLLLKLHPAFAIQMDQGEGQTADRQAFEALLPGGQVRAARPLFSDTGMGADPSADSLQGIYLLNLAAGSDVLQAAVALSANAAVEWAEPDYLAYPVATPNDPLFPQQWGLSQIEAPAAWDISMGSATLPIALIDAGLDFDHPDLAGKLWTNAGEVAGNGLDDDANGYIDDLHGWDFVSSDNDPADDNGHGAQVAGATGAATDNSAGIAGVCWDCALMPVKVMDAGGVANYSDIAAGVLYAAQKGARVINISLGGYSESAALYAAIQAAVEDYDAVVVAGAGNDALSTPFYPAAYEPVLAVAASRAGDILWGSSNTGEWVDLVAPGENIQTTFLGGDYGVVDGTSLSAALVSGLAGLLRSHFTDWSADMVRAQIIHTAEDIDPLNPGFEGLLGAGRVNANQALSTAPQPLLGFQGQTVNGSATARPEPGGRVDLLVTLYNDWADASNVQATLSSSDPNVSLVTAGASYGSIPAYDSAANATPFQFDIAASAPYGYTIPLQLRVTASGGYVVNIPISVQTASSVVYPPATIATQTWTNDRIYVINKASGIPVSNTLTIEPGTQVRFDGDFSLTVQGALVADGTTEQPIEFFASQAGQGQIMFEDSSLDAAFDGDGNYLSGSILQNCKIDSLRGIDLNSAAPYISENAWTGISEGIHGRGSPGLVISLNKMFESPIVIEGSGPIYIHGNEMDGAGITHFYGIVEIRSNRIVNSPIRVIVHQESVVIRDNLLANNNIGLMIGDEAMLDPGNITVTNNTIVSDSQEGIYIVGTGPLIQHNNLLGSGAGYALRNKVPNTEVASVDATGNWWGTAVPAEIQAAIYDGMDEFGLGIVDTSNYLSAPEPNAPAIVADVEISPDTTLGIQTATFDVHFNRDMEQGIEPEIVFQPALNGIWSTYTATNSGLPSNQINALASAPDGMIWMGTDAGAVRFDGTEWTVFDTTNSGIPGDFVLAIARADNGVIWFGTPQGAARFDGMDWTVFNTTNSGLNADYVTSIASTDNGEVWFGTPQGASRFDGTDWIAFNTTNSGLPDDYVLSIALAESGEIWFGTPQGAVRFDGTNWMAFDTTNSGLPEDYVFTIDNAQNGDMWFGTTGGGAVRFDGTDWTELHFFDPGLPEDYLNTLAGVENGEIWFGTRIAGVVRFDGTYRTVFDTNNSDLPSNNVLAIADTPDGAVWFGTDGGVAVYWNFPTYAPDEGKGYWLDASTYRATLEVTSLIPRGDYLTKISGAVGTDGIEIAPMLGYPFTVDYAGAVSDSTPPPAPGVEVCAGVTLGSLSASWSVVDPETAITLYSYAIGSSPGGAEVVSWTDTTAGSMSRADLNLIAGQTYYLAVKARNAGGLWSEAGMPPGVLAGSGLCATNDWRIYLPKLE